MTAILDKTNDAAAADDPFHDALETEISGEEEKQQHCGGDQQQQQGGGGLVVDVSVATTEVSAAADVLAKSKTEDDNKEPSASEFEQHVDQAGQVAIAALNKMLDQEMSSSRGKEEEEDDDAADAASAAAATAATTLDESKEDNNNKQEPPCEIEQRLDQAFQEAMETLDEILDQEVTTTRPVSAVAAAALDDAAPALDENRSLSQEETDGQEATVMTRDETPTPKELALGQTESQQQEEKGTNSFIEIVFISDIENGGGKEELAIAKTTEIPQKEATTTTAPLSRPHFIVANDDESENLRAPSLPDEIKPPSLHEHDDDAASKIKKEPMVQQEDKLVMEKKAIWCLRLSVMLVITAVGLAVCLSVYYSGRNNETQTFQQDYQENALLLVEAFEERLQQRLFGTVQRFSTELTSFVQHDAYNNWPYVVLPDFEQHAGQTARLADAISLALVPRVEDAKRLLWENYSQRLNGWVAEGLALQQQQHNNSSAQDDVEYSFYPTIMSASPRETETGKGPYYPIWTTYPAVSVPYYNINLNSSQDYSGAIKAVSQSGQPALLASHDYLDKASRTAENGDRYEIFTMALEQYNGATTYDNDPVCNFVYPVFDVLDDEENQQQRQVVAVLVGELYWKTYLNHVLPPGTNDGIIAILGNTCGQQYTYQINGNDATFIGHGDLHDPNYDHYVMQTDLASVMKLAYPENVDDDNVAAQQNGPCQYTLQIYPSSIYKDSFSTNTPLKYTLLVAVVILFTASVFLLYNYCMGQYRQNATTRPMQQKPSSDIKSTHLVAPETTDLDRVDEEQDVKETREKKEKECCSKITTTTTCTMAEVDQKVAEKAPAIANIYPECTVLFGDIAGFSEWSANRPPAQVFDLLETVYGSFDRIAAARGVFKIETIGDCYVATTGIIPNPQPNHAVIMVEFANDCMARLRELMIDSALVLRLGGDDTRKLGMRFGLHSGPVTAGVLRGEKSRFQIFGDAVNVAALMESQGLHNKIQVSTATANILKHDGKNHWLTPRDEPVKGVKGDLEAFWVKVKDAAAVVSSAAETLPVETAQNTVLDVMGRQTVFAFYKCENYSDDSNNNNNMASQALSNVSNGESDATPIIVGGQGTNTTADSPTTETSPLETAQSANSSGDSGCDMIPIIDDDGGRARDNMKLLEAAPSGKSNQSSTGDKNDNDDNNTTSEQPSLSTTTTSQEAASSNMMTSSSSIASQAREKMRLLEAVSSCKSIQSSKSDTNSTTAAASQQFAALNNSPTSPANDSNMPIIGGQARNKMRFIEARLAQKSESSIVLLGYT